MADWHGLFCITFRTRSIFSEIQTVLALPPLFLVVDPNCSRLFTYIRIALSDGRGCTVFRNDVEKRDVKTITILIISFNCDR